MGDGSLRAPALTSHLSGFSSSGGHSSSDDSTLRVQNLSFASRLLLKARNKSPETNELKPGLHIISPQMIVFAFEAGIEEADASHEEDMA